MRRGYWNKKRVLITGHEGFLGSWITKTLLDYGARIIGIDKVKNRPISILDGLRKDIVCLKGDITKLQMVKDVIHTYKPEVVFHLAAEAIVSESIKDPIKTFKSNIEGTWNILESARNNKFIESIVVSSSDKAYGIHKVLPYRENAPLRGIFPYDASKSCADILCFAYYNSYDVPVCVTRCGNIFGPGDSHFSRIIPYTIKNIISNKKVFIRSNGKFTRDYIYVKDVVKGYLSLAYKMQKLKLFGEAFNFSNESPISVLELIKTIYRLCNRENNYEILNTARYEIRDQYLSSKKAKAFLNWRSEYTLKEGLEETIDWYRKIFQNK